MSRQYEVIYTPQAITDLEQINEYISVELNSPKAAKHIVRKVMDQAGNLKRFPNSGEALDSFVSVKTDYRRIVSGNYLVFYRVDRDKVYIIRVIHGSRNYVRILFGFTPIAESDIDQ